MTAKEDGFVLTENPREDSTHKSQTIMNSQAQGNITSATSTMQRLYSHGKCAARSVGSMKQANTDFINYMASPSKNRILVRISRSEIQRQNGYARMPENTYMALKLSLRPDGMSEEDWQTRVGYSLAIRSNVTKEGEAWLSYLEQYKEGIVNGDIPPAFEGNFAETSNSFDHKLRQRERKKVNKMKVTIQKLLDESKKTITTAAQLELARRGKLYHFFTKREREEFWDARFEVFCWELITPSKGWVAFDDTFKDNVMKAYLKHVFAVIMDRIRANHLATKLQQEQFLAFADFDTRTLYKKPKSTSNSCSDFRGILKDCGGTPPILDSLYVFKDNFHVASS